MHTHHIHMNHMSTDFFLLIGIPVCSLVAPSALTDLKYACPQPTSS